MAKKRRPEWNVQLFQSNYKGVTGTYPRIVSRGAVTLEELAHVLQERTGIYRADTTKAILRLMANIVEEWLVEGYTVTGELGTWSPTVTGLWNFDRIQPEARAQNKAEIRYTMSPRMKKAMSDPLFHSIGRYRTAPHIYPSMPPMLKDKVEPFHYQLNGILIAEGTKLLMNGEDPSRGLYLIDAETGEERAFFAPDEMLMNSRSMLVVRLSPEKVQPGNYRLKVVSQCSTSPRPLKRPQEGVSVDQIWVE